MVVRVLGDLHRRANLKSTRACRFFRDLMIRRRYSLFMNGARSAPNKGTKMSFAKMSDLSPINKSEQAGLDSLYTTFPHAVIRHCAVWRASGVHHLVSVETAEFYVAGSGELLNEALAEVFGSLGDIELSGEIGAYAA